MKRKPWCKDCNVPMHFHEFGSMGSFHSNYYKCSKCGKIVLVRDYDLKDEGHYNC